MQQGFFHTTNNFYLMTATTFPFMIYKSLPALAGAMLFLSVSFAQQKHPQFSGIYPHLAYYNNEGECGTGAVVPWAGKLWVITYGPHLPFGSSDKLYEISPDLKATVRSESIGGTPANRLIHRETNQLFIGPYVIDQSGKVRVIPYTTAPGRYTGTARHLSDPSKVYTATMEEGFYEIDASSLDVRELYSDANVGQKKRSAEEDRNVNPHGGLLPGAHGKGLYSGQGVLVFSNNGEATEEALKKFDVEAGALAEWDGKNWKVVRRNQFVEVTGPGGIEGNRSDSDPIWATGWDHKSVLVGVRGNGTWSFFRLPKASHSYDGAHGWNTEWPRIRNVGTDKEPDYLMTMHGMFWRFPAQFSVSNTAGIRPRSAYLKVIGDFTRWNDQLVFGCDDSAQKEFLNTRTVKGGIEGPGQSNSNLWFTTPSLPDKLGPATAEGAVWLSEEVKQNSPSEPFLFSGWNRRTAWVLNESTIPVNLRFEVDKDGTGKWVTLKSQSIKAGESAAVTFLPGEKGEWVRVISEASAKLTVHFSFTDTSRNQRTGAEIFSGITSIGQDNHSAGLLYSLGENRRALGVLAGRIHGSGFEEQGYYELDADMKLVRKDDEKTAAFIREKFAIAANTITVEPSSVLIVDDKGRRWRLPLGDAKYADAVRNGTSRICREVATERDLLNVSGTFYELPAENADGFAKIRPVASHKFAIHDYASYRGLLVMTGLTDGGSANPHIITSDDGKAKLWAGTIDDLWKIGKPTGSGGPLKDTEIEKGVPSDPYLIGFYDRKDLTLSHNFPGTVIFTIEVEPVGHGPWMRYRQISVPKGKKISFTFPDEFQARWVRFVSNRNCKATAWLEYR